MTATPVLLTAGNDTTDGTVFSTASIAPGPERVLFVGVLASAPSGGNPGTPTLSADVGQTWELTRQTPDPSAVRTAYVFRSTTTSSPSSGPLTLTFPGTVNALCWAVYEVDGADLTNPAVQSIEQRLGGSANLSVDLPFPSAVDPANAVLAFIGLNTQDTIVPGTGWTGNPTQSTTASKNSLMPMHSTTALQDVTASWSAGANTWVIGVEVKAAGSTPTGPTLVSRWVGAVDTGSATVAVDTTNTSSARLVVATDSALTTGVVFGPAVTPDADGIAKLTVTGLAAGTAYFYGVELDGTVDAARGSFRTFPSGAASFSFAFGSCMNASNGGDTDSFARIHARDPDLFVHLGDFRYLNPFTNDPSLFEGIYDEALAALNESTLYANTPTTYTWSDHDYAGGSNAWSGAASKPAAQSTYRHRVPHYPLPDAEGIYHTFTVGRVRFVVTDNRSFRSSYDDPDDATKTVLGAVQKQWWKDTIANATEQLIVWAQENPWVGADAGLGDDTWGSYDTERQELAAFVQSTGKQVVIIAGDMHALAYEDGTTSAGGIPVWQAAPFLNDSSTKAGPWTASYTEPGVGRFYGWVDVTDDGTTITATFTGYDTTDTAQLTHTVTVAPDVPTGSASGSHTWTGSASGSAEHQGSSSGTHTWTASAAGSVEHQGSASGGHTWTGAASGSTAHQGTASGGHSWSGTAAGTAPAVDAATGSASGSHTWTGSASGSVTHQGATSGSHTWTGTASGTAPVPGPKAESIVDAFDVLDTGEWSADPTVEVVGGQLVVHPTQGYVSNLYSVDLYDLTESSVAAELVSAPTGPGYTDTYLQVQQEDSSNLATFDVEQTQLGCYYGPSFVLVHAETYDPVAHRWLRHGNAGGVHTWEASPDGRTWTVLASTPETGSITRLRVLLGSGGNTVTVPDAVFDNVNAYPASGSASGSHTWTGTASGVAPVVGANSGSAQGSHTWTGSASGSVEHRGAAEASWTVDGSASGTTEHSGSAAGGHTWTGTASGSAPADAASSGSASGSHTWTGTASGTAVRAGAASGTHTWTGTASGGQPIGSPVEICITWGPLVTRNTDTTLRVRELDTQVATRTLTAALEVRELDTQVATRSLATTLEEC